MLRLRSAVPRASACVLPQSRALPFPDFSRVEFIKFFAGVGNLTDAVQQCGFNSCALDVKYNEQLDIRTPSLWS